MSKKKPKLTRQAPGAAKPLRATSVSKDAVRVRRKPRKQDYVAAAIAIAIVIAMVASAFVPFLMT